MLLQMQILYHNSCNDLVLFWKKIKDNLNVQHSLYKRKKSVFDGFFVYFFPKILLPPPKEEGRL